ncbi:N-acetylmuramoyl-L-alanine amidase [Streptomyces asoensis]|uniref:peptidoglycan recognition protein family protein n=1 Tax=Streptomyces asoensis TaxID=249586 RepID=UPI003D9E4E8D
MGLRRRAWLTLGAVLVGGGGVVTYAVAHPSARPQARPERPVKVYDLTLKGASPGRLELPRTDTEPFSLLGVTWNGGAERLSGTAQVRTRGVATGEWSAWHDLGLDADPLDAPGPKVRGASEPVWVGPSDGVQVRVARENGGTAPLPEGLRVDLVDPGVARGTGTATGTAGTEPAGFVTEPSPGATDSASAEPSASPAGPTDPAPPSPSDTVTTVPTDSAEPTGAVTASPADPTPPATGTDPTGSASPTASPTPTAAPAPAEPPSTVPRPPIRSRAEWGADESISPDAPEYNKDVQVMFVHHTDGTNDYTCDQTQSVIRSIYAYHVQASGWKDIGYNFLVDKCGTLYEGRKGGVGLPVLGAHTYGWNRESAAVAVIGDHTKTAGTDAALTSIARLAAWKLGQYGIDPAGTGRLTAGATQKNLSGTSFTAGTSYAFDRISGHRDGYNTECPGGLLYDQLPAVRALAAGPVQGLKITSVAGGATLSGSAYHTRGAVTVNWSATTPSALVSRFELLADGKAVATTAGTATSASATLPAGGHTLAVRAVHQSGRTATTAALTVVADTTLPVFTTAPKLSLRTGTIDATAVPVTLGWKATDDKALRSVQLLTPSAATFGPTVTTSSRTAKPGAATTWSMRATDYAGNARTASSSFTPVILQETSATRSGSWTARSSTSYLGGKSYSSGTKGAALTWTFTGRSVAWAVSRAGTSGQAYVYVDGAKAATVDLKSATTLYRQAVWTKTWTTAAKHTVKIVVVGTAGRPTVTTDGLVYLK